MANADNADGLKPACYLNGAPYNGQANQYVIEAGEAVQVMIGDPVKLSTTASTSTKGLASVEIAASLDTVVGVVVGVLPVDRDSTIYRAASVERIVLVADDPQLLFEVQEDGALALASIGLNTNLVTAAGSTFTGMSGWEMDTSQVSTVGTYDVQIVRGVDRADNLLVSTNARWLVRLNNHQFVDGTTGV